MHGFGDVTLLTVNTLADYANLLLFDFLTVSKNSPHLTHEHDSGTLYVRWFVTINEQRDDFIVKYISLKYALCFTKYSYWNNYLLFIACKTKIHMAMKCVK